MVPETLEIFNQLTVLQREKILLHPKCLKIQFAVIALVTFIKIYWNNC
jgi:hypothetical protein